MYLTNQIFYCQDIGPYAATKRLDIYEGVNSSEKTLNLKNYQQVQLGKKDLYGCFFEDKTNEYLLPRQSYTGKPILNELSNKGKIYKKIKKRHSQHSKSNDKELECESNKVKGVYLSSHAKKKLLSMLWILISIICLVEGLLL